MATVIDELVTILGFRAETKGIDKAQSGLQKFAGRARKVGVAITAVGGALTGLGALIGRNILDFERGMNRLAAVSSATEDQMAALREQAIKLGGETAFSASQAADAQLQLAQAGFAVEETMAALPHVLNLASAGELEMGEAAGLVTSQLRAFGLEVDQAQRVTDVLALTASSANTTVSELGPAFRQVAPVAAGLGLSIEDTSAAIGVLRNNGLQAEQAGTAVRNILVRLISPTSQAAAALDELGEQGIGSARQQLSALGVDADQIAAQMLSGDLVGAMSALGEAGLDPQRAADIFGVEGLAGGLALAGQAAALEDLREKLMLAEGAAERMRLTMEAGLPGAVDSMRSAIETLVLRIGEAGFTKVLTRAAEMVRTVAQRLAEAPPWVKKLAVVLLALGPILLGVGGVLLALSPILAALATAATAAGTTMAAAFGAAAVSMWAALWPVLAVIAAVTALGVGIFMLVKHWDKVKAGVGKALRWIRGLFDEFVIWLRTSPLGNILQAMFPWLAIIAHLKELRAIAEIVLGAIGDVWDWVKERATAFWASLQQSKVWDVVTQGAETFRGVLQGIADLWDSIKGFALKILGISEEGEPAGDGDGDGEPTPREKRKLEQAKLAASGGGTGTSKRALADALQDPEQAEVVLRHLYEQGGDIERLHLLDLTRGLFDLLEKVNTPERAEALSEAASDQADELRAVDLGPVADELLTAAADAVRRVKTEPTPKPAEATAAAKPDAEPKTPDTEPTPESAEATTAAKPDAEPKTPAPTEEPKPRSKLEEWEAATEEHPERYHEEPTPESAEATTTAKVSAAKDPKPAPDDAVGKQPVRKTVSAAKEPKPEAEKRKKAKPEPPAPAPPEPTVEAIPAETPSREVVHEGPKPDAQVPSAPQPTEPPAEAVSAATHPAPEPEAALPTLPAPETPPAADESPAPAPASDVQVETPPAPAPPATEVAVTTETPPADVQVVPSAPQPAPIAPDVVVDTPVETAPASEPTPPAPAPPATEVAVTTEAPPADVQVVPSAPQPSPDAQASAPETPVAPAAPDVVVDTSVETTTPEPEVAVPEIAAAPASEVLVDTTPAEVPHAPAAEPERKPGFFATLKGAAERGLAVGARLLGLGERDRATPERGDIVEEPARPMGPAWPAPEDTTAAVPFLPAEEDPAATERPSEPSVDLTVQPTLQTTAAEDQAPGALPQPSPMEPPEIISGLQMLDAWSPPPGAGSVTNITSQSSRTDVHMAPGAIVINAPNADASEAAQMFGDEMLGLAHGSDSAEAG